MNTFMQSIKNQTNFTKTENGGIAHKTTNSAVYDLFAFGAAYRQRSDEDCIFLFKQAFEEDETLALKCLFYIRDCRGGQGERRFFRVCLRWLAKNYPNKIKHLITYLPEYGRYDDLFELFNTPLESIVINLIHNQLLTDMTSTKNGISLIAKWLPSENASNARTIARAKKIRKALNITSKEYRQMLSKLRGKINVLEKLMSANQWDKIEFDKIPSKAGLIYKNAFARRDIIAKKYEHFIKDKTTKVNATTLYPYEIVNKATKVFSKNLEDVNRLAINKYWENLPDYINQSDFNMMCVIDTSGSMTWGSNPIPIDVAIGLGLYCAERASGPFKNHYISFASRPQLIQTVGVDFVDKVKRIYRTNLCDNTNLDAVFNLLLRIAKHPEVKKEDIPNTLVIISDMDIDEATTNNYKSNYNVWSTDTVLTNMEAMRQKWVANGLKLPRLVYWNVNARHNNILDLGPDVSFVSGCSPVIFQQVITGQTGYSLMLQTLLNKRYETIHI